MCLTTCTSNSFHQALLAGVSLRSNCTPHVFRTCCCTWTTGTTVLCHRLTSARRTVLQHYPKCTQARRCHNREASLGYARCTSHTFLYRENERCHNHSLHVMYTTNFWGLSPRTASDSCRTRQRIELPSFQPAASIQNRSSFHPKSIKVSGLFEKKTRNNEHFS